MYSSTTWVQPAQRDLVLQERRSEGEDLPLSLPTLFRYGPRHLQRGSHIPAHLSEDQGRRHWGCPSGGCRQRTPQVAVLSSRIATLTEHFKTHKKDNHSRRGLLKLVALRRKHLDYLQG